MQDRFKDLVLVWHPDRFDSDSHKVMAEEELKRITGARDTLKSHLLSRAHTRSEHCICQPVLGAAAPASVANAQQARQGYKALWQTGGQATVTLVLLALGLIAFPVAWNTLFRQDRGVAPLYQRPVKVSAEQIIPIGSTLSALRARKGIDRTPVAAATGISPSRLTAPADGPSADPIVTPAAGSSAVLPASLDRVGMPGPSEETSASGDRGSGDAPNAEKRVRALNHLIAGADKDLATAQRNLQLIEKEMAQIDTEVSRHKAVMSEIEQVEKELEPAPSDWPGFSAQQAHINNPDYARHTQEMYRLIAHRGEVQIAQAIIKAGYEHAKLKKARYEQELEELLASGK